MAKCNSQKGEAQAKMAKNFKNPFLLYFLKILITDSF